MYYKKKNFVSILITNYNKEKFLKKSIKSCLKQNFKNKEIIIFDDCSDDKTKLLKNKYSMLTEKMPFQEYAQNLWNSKISLSPFGMGELCFRDLESMVFGTVILKPSHERVDTLPNIMIDDETFVSCKYDWSDLEEKIDYILSNFTYINEKINYNIRNIFNKNCTNEKLCLYYHGLFSNLDDVAVS